MKPVIARLNPVTNTPVVFLPETLKDSQMDAFVDGQIKRVGWQFYQHSQRLTKDAAVKVAQLFAEHENIPIEQIHVRERMPKTKKEEKVTTQHNRRTNDANLKLVDTETNGDKQKLAKAAQELHDKGTQTASASNPEGATVQQRTKRPYRKQSEKELSKRSAAALKRYQEELTRTAAQSPTLMEPVAPNAPKEVVDAAILELATALAKIMKGVV